MALRRGAARLNGLLGRLARMAGPDSPTLPVVDHIAPPAPTLVCLRSLWAPAAPPAGLRATAAAPLPGARCVSNSAARRSASTPAAAVQDEEESLEHIRARIFRTHIGNGLRSGRKVLRRPLLGQKVMEYYPPDPVKEDPLMLNLKAESAKLKLDKLRRRGKAPPKKGAGKRAGKKR